jgi:hypothetical protein
VIRIDLQELRLAYQLRPRRIRREIRLRNLAHPGAAEYHILHRLIYRRGLELE